MGRVTGDDMIPSFKQFAALCAKTLPISEPIFEFGSLQVPNQIGFADLRPLFPGRIYVGTDMRPGPGVDKVLNLHHLDLPDESIGTGLLIATIEHVEFPREAIHEIFRVLKPGGWLAMASHMNFPIHSHPYDYWRFTPEAFRSLLKPFAASVVDCAGEPLNPHSVVGIGFKSPVPDLALVTAELQRWNHNLSCGWRQAVKPFVPPILLKAYRKFVPYQFN